MSGRVHLAIIGSAVFAVAVVIAGLAAAAPPPFTGAEAGFLPFLIPAALSRRARPRPAPATPPGARRPYGQRGPGAPGRRPLAGRA